MQVGVRILVARPVRCVADRQLAAGHPRLDMDVVKVPRLVLAMQQLDRYTTADQVPEAALQLVDVVANFGLDLGGGRHTVKGNLERSIHHSLSPNIGNCRIDTYVGVVSTRLRPHSDLANGIAPAGVPARGRGATSKLRKRRW